MENQNNAIEIRNMYKKFKVVYDKPNTLKERLVFWKRSNISYRTVLENINLDIEKGDTVALIGTNGCGKSTLLKLMTKILYPNKGYIETNGKLASLLELGAGFHPDFTGRENIYFNAAIFGLTRQEIDERLTTIIEFSELGKFIDNPVRTYSSGMYMRLAFSIAINVDADILLIDEILAVGDQHFQDKCFERLQELKRSEMTIIIVSHSLDSVKKLCTRAIWIYDGQVEFDGDTEEAITKYLTRIENDYSISNNKEIRKKDHYDGIMHIDLPEKETTVKSDNQEFLVRGWELSECAESNVKVYIDGVEKGFAERKGRPDVVLTYEGQYGGTSTNLQSGWGLHVDLSGLEAGEHLIKVIVVDENDNQISKEERMFYVIN